MFTAADYRVCAQQFCDRMMRVEGVLGVGQFGAVRVPGISDIDLVVVVDDTRVAELLPEVLAVRRGVRNGEYLIAQRPAVVPVQLVPHVASVRTFDGLHPLAGNLHGLDEAPQLPMDQEGVRSRVWSGFFWTLFLDQAGQDRVSLRRAMLLAWNAALCASAEWRISASPGRSKAIRAVAHEIRSEVTRLQGRARLDTASEGIQTIMDGWCSALNAGQELAELRTVRMARGDTVVTVQAPATYLNTALAVDSLLHGRFRLQQTCRGVLNFESGVSAFARDLNRLIAGIESLGLIPSQHRDLIPPLLGQPTERFYL